MRLTVTVTGEDVVAYDLLRFGDRMLNLRPALAMVAAEVREDAAQRFEDEGPGWAPLAESTIAAKGGSRILFETGSLMDSLAKLGGDHVEILTDDSLTMSSSLMVGNWSLGELHQKGTSRMPAREVVGSTEEQRRDYIRTIQDWVVQGLALTFHEAEAVL